MCYYPYDHSAMLRDISARTEGVAVPTLHMPPAIGAFARILASLFRRAKHHDPAVPTPIAE